MKGLAPIPTQYAGLVFRSRIEARWAVFFRTLRVSFRYEEEGFQIGTIRYLPDFFLPDLDAFFEVKGQQPNEKEVLKARELSTGSGKRVFIAWGPIPTNPADDVENPDSAWAFVPGEAGLADQDIGWWWCRCPGCGRFDIQYQGRHARMACGCTVKDDDRAQSFEHPLILAAYERARIARFEFGEMPW